MGKESFCNAGYTGDAGSIPESGRSPGGGHGNPLQCSCLENPIDRGACWATQSWGCKESDTIEATEHILKSSMNLTNFKFHIIRGSP